MTKQGHDTYWGIVGKQFGRHRLGMAALSIVFLFVIVGIYAPFLASSKPLVVRYEDTWFFPLFAYLFQGGFFTKRIDLFYNLLMFTLPLFCAAFWLKGRWRGVALAGLFAAQMGLFIYFAYGLSRDPASDPVLNLKRQQMIEERRRLPQGVDPLLLPVPKVDSWSSDLAFMNSYAKLNLLVRYQLEKEQNERLSAYRDAYVAAESQGSHVRKILEKGNAAEVKRALALPTLFEEGLANEEEEIARQQQVMEQLSKEYPQAKRALEQLKTTPSPEEKAQLIHLRLVVSNYEQAQAKINYLQERRHWLVEQSKKLSFRIMPLLRPFHWEDDAGGEQDFNQQINWMERTRINRKDLMAALLFGIRISLMVGIMSIGLALLIGVPIGALAGYYGGRFDIVVSRLLEIWESMPTFFMLLMVVAITQSKSVFLVIAVIGLFGWTGFSRFLRGEFFKQRNLPYVEACRALGFGDGRIIFGHILANAIPPLLTLLPFAIMGAISAEAGLSFLGLGEEGSCSWGVLMDEGRTAFPGESYLLWPPAILLTLLLVAIALVGDALRDSLDPRMKR